MLWRAVVWWGAILTALLLGLEGDLRIAGRPFLLPGAVWWASALLVLVIAAIAADFRVPAAERRPWTRWDLLALLAVVAATMTAHLWRISEYPPPDLFAYEEYQTGAVAYGVVRNWYVPLEFPVTNILPAVSFRLLGMSPFSLRLPFVLCGLLAPPLVFLALRRLARLPAAWAAAMLLAVARYPAMAPRFADEIFHPFWLLAAGLWLLVWAVQSRWLRIAFIAGCVTAPVLYEYASFKPFPVIALAAVTVMTIVGCLRGRVPAGAFRPIALFVAVWLVLIGPGLARSWNTPGVLWDSIARHQYAWENAPPAERTLSYRLQVASENARAGAELFLRRSPEAGANLPGEPMLDPVAMALVIVAVVAAVLRRPDPWRAWTLATFALMFVAAAVLPHNFWPARYYPMLLPLYCLMAFLFDDVLRWWPAAERWICGGLVLLVGSGLVVNLRGIERMARDPVLRRSFETPGNTLLAAVNQAPAGFKVRLLTNGEGRNAFEPSDYVWLTDHLKGKRAESLAEALTIPRDQPSPLYWVTQDVKEAELVGEVVSAWCPGAATVRYDAPNPAHTITMIAVAAPTTCTPPASAGLEGRYLSTDATGHTLTRRQIDPALTIYTIPVALAEGLGQQRLQALHVDWRGVIVAPKPGRYDLRLDVLDARATMRAGSGAVKVAPTAPGWQRCIDAVDFTDAPVPIEITLDAWAGSTPRVRLTWHSKDGGEAIIPPAALRPAAADVVTGSASPAN